MMGRIIICLKVKVVFSLTPDMLRRDSLAEGDSCEDELERKLHFMDDLRIRIFSSPYPGCGHLLAEVQFNLFVLALISNLIISLMHVISIPLKMGCMLS